MPITRKQATLGGNKTARVLALLSELPADKGLYSKEVQEAVDISDPHLFKVGKAYKCSVRVFEAPGHEGHGIRVYVNPKHFDKWQ